MALADYGSLAEIIGVFGMIASLIYVCYQLQQARVQLRGQAAQSRTDATINLWKVRFDPAFREAELKSATQLEELSPAEALLLETFFVPWIEYTQNLFYQSKLGLLDSDQSTWLDTMPLLRNTVYRTAWQDFRESRAYPADFVAHVDNIIAEQDADDHTSGVVRVRTASRQTRTTS